MFKSITYKKDILINNKTTYFEYGTSKDRWKSGQKAIFYLNNVVENIV